MVFKKNCWRALCWDRGMYGFVRVGILASLMVWACTERPGPQVLSVVPSGGHFSTSTPVQINGRNFRPHVFTSYDDEEKSKISTLFVARLEETPLREVTYKGPEILTAIVPAGLSVGQYNLTVIDPSGSQVTLKTAFEVRAHDPTDGGLGCDTLSNKDLHLPDKDGSVTNKDQHLPDKDSGVVNKDQHLPDKDSGVVNKDQHLPDKDSGVVNKDLPSTDGTGGINPLSAGQISSAWLKLSVQCVDRFGKQVGGKIPIVDTGQVKLFPASVSLFGAPQSTKSWVGSHPAVTIVWNPNACDYEDPFINDGDWHTAGLLVRRAALVKGNLVFEASATIKDINVINVNENGFFEGPSDFAEPDDSKLSYYPQLINSINAAKSALFDLAKK